MTEYYDAVLGLIPLALIGITIAVVLVGFSLATGVVLGSTAAIGIIGHAMFVNGPVDDVAELTEVDEIEGDEDLEVEASATTARRTGVPDGD